MMSNIIVQVLDYVISVGIAALVPIVIRYILTKTHKENLLKYASMAEIVVKALEQTMGVDSVAKKTAAVSKLASMTNGKVSSDDINHLIESAVYNLKVDVKRELEGAPEVKDTAAVPVV